MYEVHRPVLDLCPVMYFSSHDIQASGFFAKMLVSYSFSPGVNHCFEIIRKPYKIILIDGKRSEDSSLLVSSS
jgi:hypothetical protein